MDPNDPLYRFILSRLRHYYLAAEASKAYYRTEQEGDPRVRQQPPHALYGQNVGRTNLAHILLLELAEYTGIPITLEDLIR